MKGRQLANKIIQLDIWLLLLPLLLVYILVVLIAGDPVNLSGDEGRYLKFADNLLHGYYSPPFPNMNLWNGPGYPLFISPFLALDVPLQGIRLANAFLLYFCLIMVYKTIRQYCSPTVALLSVVMLGSFFPAYLMLKYLLTESLSWFLMSVIGYSVVKYFREDSARYGWLASLAIAFLALVKVMFGYVILVIGGAAILLYIFRQRPDFSRRILKLTGGAFLFFLPYVLYTWQLTGKVFYLTNAGGMSLYTMSTPYEGEFGDWINDEALSESRHHRVFMDSISGFLPLERDEAFRKAAFQNIQQHPRKYLMNCMANISRLLLEYPFSYKPARVNTLFYIVPGMMLGTLILFALIALVWAPRRLPDEMLFLLFFTLVYLGGSVLVSAYSRMFYITLPYWTLLFSYVFSHIVRIRFYPVQNTVGL